MKKIGIYQIRNNISEKAYIGLSSDIENRFVRHKMMLNNNSHRNKYLQFAFNKYGESSFKFEILEECEEQLLSDREKHWISEKKSCNNKYGYNKTFGGEFGRLHPDIYKRYSERLKGGHISEEQKKQISKTLTGRKRPKKEIEKAARSCRKCDDRTEMEMMDLFNNGFMIKEIAKMYNTKYSIVASIRARHREK